MTMSKRDQRLKQAYGLSNPNPVDLIEIWLTTNYTQPTPKRLSVLESLKTLRDELAKFDFKDTLDGIIKSIRKEEDSETFKILEAFVENLKIVHERGALDATREILTAIFRFLEIKKHEEGRNRTRAATFARKGKILPGLKDKQKNGFGSKVFPFFQEVEDKWHPKVEHQKHPRSRSKNSKKSALDEVYLTHREEIAKAAEESGISQEGAFRIFCRMFDLYTDWTIKKTGSTANGYKKEKRAARSDESKQKARDTALKNVEKKRWRPVSFLAEASKAYDKYYKEMTEQGSIPDSNHEH